MRYVRYQPLNIVNQKFLKEKNRELKELTKKINTTNTKIANLQRKSKRKDIPFNKLSLKANIATLKKNLTRNKKTMRTIIKQTGDKTKLYDRLSIRKDLNTKRKFNRQDKMSEHAKIVNKRYELNEDMKIFKKTSNRTYKIGFSDPYRALSYSDRMAFSRYENKKNNKKNIRSLLKPRHRLASLFDELIKVRQEYLGPIQRKLHSLEREIDAYDKQIRKNKIPINKTFHLYVIESILNKYKIDDTDFMLKLDKHAFGMDATDVKMLYGELVILDKYKWMRIPVMRDIITQSVKEATSITSIIIRIRNVIQSSALLEQLGRVKLSEQSLDRLISRVNSDSRTIPEIIKLKTSKKIKAKLIGHYILWNNVVGVVGGVHELNLIKNFAKDSNIIERQFKFKSLVNKLGSVYSNYKTKKSKKTNMTGTIIKSSPVKTILRNLNRKNVERKSYITKLEKNLNKIKKSPGNKKSMKNQLSNYRKKAKKITLFEKRITNAKKERKSIETNIKKHKTLLTIAEKQNKALKTITRKVKQMTFKEHVKIWTKKRAVIGKFLEVLEQDKRRDVKQAYKLFKKIMIPDDELHYASETAHAKTLKNTLSNKGMLCHLGSSNSASFIRNFLANLRNQLYTMADLYFKGMKNLNRNDKEEYRKNFLDRFQHASGDPCIEGTFTALVNTVADPNFTFKGKNYTLEIQDPERAITLLAKNFIKPAMISMVNGWTNQEINRYGGKDGDPKYRMADNKLINMFWGKIKTLRVLVLNGNINNNNNNLRRNLQALPHSIGKKATIQYLLTKITTTFML